MDLRINIPSEEETKSSTAVEILKAQRKMIKEVVQDFTCWECETQFKDWNGLRRHMETAHFGRRFTCELCKKDFKDSVGLLRHNNTVHLRMRFNCANCEKDFSRKDILREHIRSAHSKIGYACKVCEKVFAKKRDFHTHEKSKVCLETYFSCDACPKYFRKENNLKLHVKAAHLDSGFTCETCGKNYFRKYNLQLHVQSEHMGVWYTCGRCEKKFPRESIIKTHSCKALQSSQQKKEDLCFTCDMCGKTYFRKYNLQVHVRTEHLGMWFVCQYCGRKFPRKSQMKSHNCKGPKTSRKSSAKTIPKNENRSAVKFAATLETNCGTECDDKKRVVLFEKNGSKSETNQQHKQTNARESNVSDSEETNPLRNFDILNKFFEITWQY